MEVSKYEYKVQNIYADDSGFLEELLNKGWEVVSVVGGISEPHNSNYKIAQYVLRKLISLDKK